MPTFQDIHFEDIFTDTGHETLSSGQMYVIKKYPRTQQFKSVKF